MTTETLTTLGEWTHAGESHEILAVACPISTVPEFNDGQDLQLFCRCQDIQFTIMTDVFLSPHVAALWEAAQRQGLRPRQAPCCDSMVGLLYW